MRTIHLSAQNRNPGGKNVYRARQTERPGWRPRRGSQRRLAQDIAASIRQHRAAGDTRWIQPHEFTPNPETQALVQQLLDADAQVEAEAESPTELGVEARDETQDTVITECHGEDHVILCDVPMTMDEAIALVERIERRDKTKFVIFQPDRAVGLYR